MYLSVMLSTTKTRDAFQKNSKIYDIKSFLLKHIQIACQRFTNKSNMSRPAATSQTNGCGG